MKKVIVLLVVAIISVLAVTSGYFSIKPNIESKSAILMDATNGKILFEKDSDTAYPVASMSKMMTEYIVLDHIKEEIIQWDDEVIISEKANNVIPGAAILPVEVGARLTIEELYSAMIVSSSNNAAIALAEMISGTENDFTILMNQKAHDIGLSGNAYFVNATGLPNTAMNNLENEMSALDVATLAYHLINDYPEVLDTTSQQNYYIKSSDITIYNTNKMLLYGIDENYFKPVDGLKTGYTNAAGYCFVSTAVKNDTRLISVIINANDEDERFIETKKLLSFGFNDFNFPDIREIIKTIVNRH